MFALLSMLLDVISAHAGRILDGRRVVRDSQVGERLLLVVLDLQELCVRGDRLLALLHDVLDDPTGAEADPAVAEADPAAVRASPAVAGTDPAVAGRGGPGAGWAVEFDRLLREQTATIRRVRDRLDESRALLATVDAGFTLDLAPFLDVKSGLLTRWTQQVEQSRYSSTTLFFLPAGEVRRMLAAAAPYTGPDGLASDRAEYLVTLADGLREVRRREVRDIRTGSADHADRLRAEAAAARSELDRAKSRCAQLSTAIGAAVGPDALARLRRRIVARS